jgi:large subunit ribosomal protein L3
MPLEGLLGRKLGMTQIFDRGGTMQAVTVVEVTPLTVTQVKTKVKDGYDAIQTGSGTRKKVNKPMRGHMKKLGDFGKLAEFRVRGDGEYVLGDSIGMELFNEGDLVDVRGVSRGRGFAGGVRRHHFHGGPKTHGQSDRHRAPGSIGSGTTPGRVYKGLKMSGHMGHERVTIKKLRVVRVDAERNLILVKGSVPGAPGALTFVKKA